MAAAGKRKATALDTLPPIAGGAMVVSMVMYPADVVRALCMSQPGLGAGAALKGFLEVHGVMGFVKQGLVAEVIRASTSRGIKFFFQPICHQNFFGKPETQGNPVTKGLAGSLATFPEVVAISPLENIKLAAQLDKDKKFNGNADIAKHLIRTRGVFGGLFIGYFGMQCRQCLWTGGFFLTLDAFKDGLKSTGVFTNNLAVDVIGGFGAGAFGTAVNCWTDVCRSVIQKQAVADTFNPEIKAPSALEHFMPGAFFGQAAKIYGAKGMAGLYAGVGPKMVHLGGSGALLAVLMPRFKTMWFDMNGIA
jgi:solute carrier family 25 2-oxodicarboxylate transporter 21